MNSLSVSLFQAFGWGFVSASAFLIGALLGIFGSLPHKAIARTMAIGAGLLLAAASIELSIEALKNAAPILVVVVLLSGAAIFSFLNAVLAANGAKHRKRCGQCVAQPSEVERAGSGTAIALGTAIDAIPEALILGVWLSAHGLDAVLIAAITIANFPEALSAAEGMRRADRPVGWILGMWGGIAAMTTVLTGVGFALAGSSSQSSVAILQAFAAGALISMVSETMLPEAVHDTPHYVGLVATVGFAILLLLHAFSA